MSRGEGQAQAWDAIFSRGEKTTGGLFFYALAAERIRAGDAVCDAGCGYAFYLRELLAKCGPQGSFLGVDISSVALSRNREAFQDLPNARFILADLLALPLPDESVDWALCAETLPYLLADAESAFRELARVSRSGVIFSLHTRGTYEIKGTAMEFRGNTVIEHKPGAKPPRRMFSEEEILRLVEATGRLRVNEMRPFRWGDLYTGPDGMEWPWFLPPPERIALYYVVAGR